MVKADPKRDYYADLDLPPTADTETIKKRFRELAKQYHPDRNPGREVDVVPRFQAVQAANEILSDPNQRAKYDSERAKLNKPTSTDPPIFRRPAPKTPTNYNVPNPPPPPPPPPRRDANSRGAYQQSNPPRRPNSASSNSADRFASFGRAAPPQPQTWDRARFEESRAEALRGMNAMKSGQTSQVPPSRPSRHPTAPKNVSTEGPYSAGAGPPPGYPGLGRTPSQRKGFSPAMAGVDEPSASSAYAHFNRPERPPSTDPYPRSPQQTHSRHRPSVSPLRHAKSSGFDDFHPVRPGMTRTSSRYAGHSGEKTRINTGNLGRSASVRTSPIDPRYEERGPFGASRMRQEKPEAYPRHRSLSPKARPDTSKLPFEFSASDTSSEGGDAVKHDDRPKATPRRPGGPYMPNRTMSGDEALTGQFPSTNYTRVVDDNHYEFPPPESKGTPARRPFANMTSPTDYFATLNTNTTETAQPTEPEPSGQDQTNDAGIPSDNPNPESSQSAFSAHEWHDKFQNGDYFKPNESTAQGRKSPTKRNPKPTSRNRGFSKSQDDLGEHNDSATAENQPVLPEDAQAKAAAFQAGKFSAEDWAERLKSQTDLSGSNVKPSKRGSSTKNTTGSQQPSHVTADIAGDYQTGPDEMDLDDPNDNTIPSKFTPNGAPLETPVVNGDKKTETSSFGGVDLNDLSRTVPLAPSETGLGGMDDLGTSLPFESRPAHHLNLGRTHSQTLRDLNLPRPPRPVEAPPYHGITQSSWKQYTDSMTAYMHDWNSFNRKMIEHFNTRQDLVDKNMYRNWVSAQGDGVSADDFDRSHGHDKAGYATYMAWLEDDRKCRTWWDQAYDEHRNCLENLGKIRQKVKAMSG